MNFLVETRDVSQFVPRRILQLGERRSSAHLLGSHQAGNLHCLGLSLSSNPSVVSNLHISRRGTTHTHQRVCLYISFSTRSITRPNINHVVFFRVCSLAVTSHSLSLSGTNAGSISSATTSHSVPVVVPIFVIDVELFVNIIARG